MAFYKMKMKNALSESEDKYRLLIENADDPIAIINYDGQFLRLTIVQLFLDAKRKTSLVKPCGIFSPRKRLTPR